MAIGLALLPFVALWWQPGRTVVEPRPKGVLLVPIVERPSRTEPDASTPSPVAPAATSARRARPQPRDRAAPAIPPESPAARITPPSLAEAGPDAPVGAASAPLDLGPSVIGSAARAGRSGFRTLAESSGAYIGEPPGARADTLAGAVAASARPDCIAPDEGASLLSALVIPYLAAVGACK